MAVESWSRTLVSRTNSLLAAALPVETVLDSDAGRLVFVAAAFLAGADVAGIALFAADLRAAGVAFFTAAAFLAVAAFLSRAAVFLSVACLPVSAAGAELVASASLSVGG